MLIALFAVFAVGSLSYLQLSHRRTVKTQRGGCFEQTKHLFDNTRLTQDSLNYPILQGTYLGYPIKLEPIIDTLGFRKLPVLWLLVTYYKPLPVTSPVDVLLRPTGSEFFSPNATFVHDVAPGKDWPEHLRISTPAPSHAPPLSVFHPFVPFLADPSTKEVLVTANGVRVVHLLAEASQSAYRVTRSVALEDVALTPARLRPLLGVLHDLSSALAYEPRTTSC